MALFVGLTGGIASGKSTVARLLSARNIPVIDTDLISRELVEPGQPCLNELCQHFGPEILNEDGHLNRKTLREKIFTDSSARAVLETILHPQIRRIAKERAEQSATQAPYVLVVVPLLADPKVQPHYQWLDYVVGVRATPAIQKARLLERPGIDPPLADQMISAQSSDRERDAIVNEWIVNTGDLTTLARQVDQCHHKLLMLTAERTSSE
ncbi:dephospho-CoA kinase [Halothiobacillus neapolitanus]|uniref:Dephospho-CoA kinase n=1 Tax=Halothiobacillus neapolitanus (strain ATCC 23641 / DSM 15147 / CIP 104769 / NCIMB 8539 / c2) TaxID=555778 RepID=D0L139_HALNC|nr:dephospho-CoA kinase [Halothiobacillus neapolitanus]ACX96412.1 dephospho-CoA kinase [Halothiobacillus neapolitanus c2]TDN66727.1 dephospho-CoA kinase [Halothiobacillus neapolitanus]